MKGISIVALLVLACSVVAQTTYNININLPEKEVRRGHLDLGGSNPAGDEFSVTSYYIEKNGKPFFPVVGELHYARYPEAYWEESILKMKAGGINVIASYVFWNIHERQEGEFDWSGDLNLRKFVELIGKHGLYAIVRLGPFCHGEIRNGGIPDWLYGRPFEIRSNDPGYLHYVDLLYENIGSQLKGLLFKDGGPVIGVQLENEYQHSAAPWEWTYPGANREPTVAQRDAALANEQITVTDGKNPWSEYGKRHMKHLKEIAKKHGMDVPLYTATGWGNATIVDYGSLPVTAGYAYPFWASPKPSPFYLFKDIHRIPDYSPVSFDATLYPSIPAEIGPGIQVKHTRRPHVPYESVSPLMVRILGSGSNGIGYYMYHGGSTPEFNGMFFNEEVNGLPRVNYDFQAPIGQYGQVRFHYRHLRMLHLFLDSWGAMLAPMKSVLPETNAGIKPDNTKVLRYAIRSQRDTGFVFIINFQDYLELEDIKDVAVDVETSNKSIRFPLNGMFDVLQGTSAILPFNLMLDNALLKSATVQPLTILPDHYVFSMVKGMDAELIFPAGTQFSQLRNARVTTVNGFKRVTPKSDDVFSFKADGANVLVLTTSMALNASRIGDRLFISEAVLLEKKGGLQLISRQIENSLHVFPAEGNKLVAADVISAPSAVGAAPLELNGQADAKSSINGQLPKPGFSAVKLQPHAKPLKGFASYRVLFSEIKPTLSIQKISEQKYTVQLLSDFAGLHDIFLETDYVGDRALAFVEGKMITDHFFHERHWEIGLRSIASELKTKELLLFFHPIYSSYGYLGDLKRSIEFKDNKYLEVNEIKAVPEYSAEIWFK